MQESLLFFFNRLPVSKIIVVRCFCCGQSLPSPCDKYYRMMATVGKSNHKVAEQISRKVYLPRSNKNTLQDVVDNNNVKMVDASIQRSKDEELTSLSWLQNTNLLQSINLSSASQQQQLPVKAESEEVEAISENESSSSSCDGLSDQSSSEAATQQPSLELSDNLDLPPLSKPPHSFSSLIFLAIESSPSKALPVREIYSFITKHFPYYRQAPVGWKNSVRHNLSLNKCFYKVEGGLNMTKGSLWMVEPMHRPQLVQSLCKVSYIKTELIEKLMNEKKPAAKARVVILENPVNLVKQKNLPDPELFPFLTRRLAVSGKTVEGPDVDAATAMLALGHCPGVKDNSEEEAPSSDHTYSSIQRPVAAMKRPLPDDQVPDASRELEVPYTTTPEQPVTKLSRRGQTAPRGKSR